MPLPEYLYRFDTLSESIQNLLEDKQVSIPSGYSQMLEEWVVQLEDILEGKSKALDLDTPKEQSEQV